MKKTLLIGFLGILVTAPSFVLSAGFNVNGATVTLTGLMTLSTMDDVTLSNGSFDAGGAFVQVSGNWDNLNGSFVPGTSIVTFQGASTSTSKVSGSTTFYSLQCVTAGKTLSFAAGSMQIITGPLILTGALDNPLRVRSSLPGSYAFLVSSGTNAVTDIDAQDNNAAGGLMIAARGASIDSGHTVNWSFDSAPTPPLAFTGMALGVSSISWTWAAVTGATSYNVYAAGTPATLMVSETTNTFTETGLSANTSYARVVTAVVSGLQSGPSNSATVVTSNNVGSGAPAPIQFDLLPGSPYPRILTPHRPENRHLYFRFINPNNDAVEISIYDFRDRKIRDLDANASGPIPGAVVWDVKDDSGQVVPGGIYLYTVKAGGVTKTGGVVVAR